MVVKRIFEFYLGPKRIKAVLKNGLDQTRTGDLCLSDTLKLIRAAL